MKKLALLLIIPFSLLLGSQMARAQNKAKATASTHMKASTQRPTASANGMWDSFKPETLNGTISIIVPGKKEMFLSADGGSYEFRMTPRTKIRINGTSSTIAQLADQANKQATVSFVAWPKGDIASSIKVSS